MTYDVINENMQWDTWYVCNVFANDVKCNVCMELLFLNFSNARNNDVMENGDCVYEMHHKFLICRGNDMKW